jgi:hypothetical protein
LFACAAEVVGAGWSTTFATGVADSTGAEAAAGLPTTSAAQANNVNQANANQANAAADTTPPADTAKAWLCQREA